MLSTTQTFHWSFVAVHPVVTIFPSQFNMFAVNGYGDQVSDGINIWLFGSLFLNPAQVLYSNACSTVLSGCGVVFTK